MTDKKLTLKNGWVGGVFAGIGEYTGYDPNIYRLIFFILLFCTDFTVVLPYLIAWWLIPDEGE